jgi:hypothetical protein
VGPVLKVICEPVPEERGNQVGVVVPGKTSLVQWPKRTLRGFSRE